MLPLALAGHYSSRTWVCWYQSILEYYWLELRTMEVVVTTGATSRAKHQSNHHHQQN